MAIQQRIVLNLLEGHPRDAASALERLSQAEAAGILSEAPAKIASAVLARMVPNAGAAVLASMLPQTSTPILNHMNPNAAAGILRRLGPDEREGYLTELSSRNATSIRRLLRYRENTAGALMDPTALTLPGDISVKEAMKYVRSAPEQARHNLYIVDRDGVLIGTLNFRELFLAKPATPLSTMITTPVHSISVRADRRAILIHPAWREVHALPVVDEKKTFLGVIRYRTLRRLEQELSSGHGAAATSAAEALGDLFGAGVAGLIGAMAPRRSPDGR